MADRESAHAPGEKRDTNRLIDSKSPYLLQHAHNPVDWYPWGEEAFETARREDKPIFLSIGYSTCHWCHVMERESFENPQVAVLMNEAFVSIKVDREERPDIDGVYMTVCQMMTGSGGWPMTILMTADRKPFYAATYIPPEGRWGRIGMVELIRKVKELWGSKRPELLSSADDVTAALRQATGQADEEEVGPDALDAAFSQLGSQFDEAEGGFGEAPKFPTPHNLLFLLRYWHGTGEPRALAMVEATLDAMRRGGIYDHVGFGFHRYSTDRRWLVPHFEKMLYDQALLAMAYAEAFQATGKDACRRTTEEIFAYVLRDMTSAEGAFYCAEDADSEGTEGKFYVWTRTEIDELLGTERSELFCRAFNIAEDGNYHEETGGPSATLNIPHLRKPLGELAAEAGLSEAVLRGKLDAVREVLFAAREKRVHPHKDDKILTDWNGLMIAALAAGGRILSEPRYADAACRAADFLLARLRTDNGRLLHRFRDGEAGVTAHLDDYAFLIWGLTELYEATFQTEYLHAAVTLQAQQDDHFADEEQGGYYFSADDAEALLVRRKESYDGATPSGNSVTLLNLLRLGRLTGNPDLERRAEKLGRAFGGAVNGAPVAHTQFLITLDFALGPSCEVVVVGRRGEADTEAMLQALRGAYAPRSVVVFRDAGGNNGDIDRLAPFSQGKAAQNGKATAFVCTNYNCKLPTTDPGQMLALLPRNSP